MRDYCDVQAGFWLNSKFWSKFSSLPLSGIEDQNTPPPPPNFGKLQIWDDQSLLQNTPPPHFGKLQTWGDQVYSGIPHPPISENFRFGMTKVYSRIPTPPPILENFRFGMTKVYSRIPAPPHFGKLQIWDDQSLLQNTPPPREFKNAESYYMWRLYPTGITTRYLPLWSGDMQLVLRERQQL